MRKQAEDDYLANPRRSLLSSMQACKRALHFFKEHHDNNEHEINNIQTRVKYVVFYLSKYCECSHTIRFQSYVAICSVYIILWLNLLDTSMYTSLLKHGKNLHLFHETSVANKRRFLKLSRIKSFTT